MNCRDVEPRLTDHVHETLDRAEAAAVAEHLASCGACARAYCQIQAEMRGISAAYAERPSAATRDALRARVEAEFARPAPQRRVFSWLRRPVPAYGAMLAAAVPLLLWAASRVGEPEPPPDTQTEPVPAPARIHHYDATVPLFDRNVS